MASKKTAAKKKTVKRVVAKKVAKAKAARKVTKSVPKKERKRTAPVVPAIPVAKLSYQPARQKLPALLREYAAYKEDIDILASLQSDIADEIKGLVKEGKIAKTVGEGLVVSMVKPEPSKAIVPELLLKYGVRQSIIAKATKETPRKPYYRIDAEERPNAGHKSALAAVEN